MTNGNSASAKLADFLQSLHDDGVNGPAKLEALLQSCKAQKDRTACNQLVTRKQRLQSSVLQSSCKAIKRCKNKLLRQSMTTTRSPYLYR
jgi:3-methyladenine DNA glycosylase Mpg